MIFHLFQCMSLSSRVAGSSFFKDNDHMHTNRCPTHDMLLSSLSPLCTTRLACISVYYTTAYGMCLVFNCLTPAFFTSALCKVVILLRNSSCKGHHVNFCTNKRDPAHYCSSMSFHITLIH